MSASQLPLRYDIEVPSDGRIEMQLPLRAGSHVTILVVETPDTDVDDAQAASEALAGPVESDVLYQDLRRELGFND
jgi:hypothetical protein